MRQKDRLLEACVGYRMTSSPGWPRVSEGKKWNVQESTTCQRPASSLHYRQKTRHGHVLPERKKEKVLTAKSRR